MRDECGVKRRMVVAVGKEGVGGLGWGDGGSCGAVDGGGADVQRA